MIIGIGVPVAQSQFFVGPDNYVASFTTQNAGALTCTTTPVVIATLDLGARVKGERLRIACLGEFTNSASPNIGAPLTVRHNVGTGAVVFDGQWGARAFNATPLNSSVVSYADEVFDAVVIQSGTVQLVYRINNGFSNTVTVTAASGIFSVVVYQ